jgi:hypothetical protein
MRPNTRLSLLLLSLVLTSCETGYHKENGSWVWVTRDESHGRRAHPIAYAEVGSFEVLRYPDFAKDQAHAYYQGRMIPDADPATFEVLSEKGYSKDQKHVYLDHEKVIFARPATFELLEFPYARDDLRLYCGTLPIQLSTNELGEFRVTNEDKLMAGMKSTMIRSHFVELNPDYAWLDSLKTQFVIVGEWGTGETRSKKIRGFSVVD